MARFNIIVITLSFLLTGFIGKKPKIYSGAGYAAASVPHSH